jgi:hypothetical protein
MSHNSSTDFLPVESQSQSSLDEAEDDVLCDEVEFISDRYESTVWEKMLTEANSDASVVTIVGAIGEDEIKCLAKYSNVEFHIIECRGDLIEYMKHVISTTSCHNCSVVDFDFELQSVNIATTIRKSSTVIFTHQSEFKCIFLAWFTLLQVTKVSIKVILNSRMFESCSAKSKTFKGTEYRNTMKQFTLLEGRFCKSKEKFVLLCYPYSPSSVANRIFEEYKRILPTSEIFPPLDIYFKRIRTTLVTDLIIEPDAEYYILCDPLLTKRRVTFYPSDQAKREWQQAFLARDESVFSALKRIFEELSDKIGQYFMTVLRDLGRIGPLEKLNITIKEIRSFLQGETGKSCSTSALKQFGIFGTFSCFVNSKNKGSRKDLNANSSAYLIIELKGEYSGPCVDNKKKKIQSNTNDTEAGDGTVHYDGEVGKKRKWKTMKGNFSSPIRDLSSEPL